VLDPGVAALIRSSRDAWLQHHPVAASLWNEPVWDAAEDLSDKGLDAWIEALDTLQSRIDEQHSGSISPVSAAALSELQRFVNEQKLRHVKQAIYCTQAGSYLQLCAFALLPFWLQLQVDDALDTEMQGRLLYRTRQCIEWLDFAEKRMGAAELSCTARDKTIVSQLIDTLVSADQFTSEPVRTLIDQLDRWTRMPLLETQRSTPQVGLRWYLKSVLQLEPSETVLLETLLARIEKEIGELKRIVDEQLPVSNVDPADADLLLCMAGIESSLRESVARTTLDSLGARATILFAPPCLSTLVEDALYLPPTITGKRTETGGWLLINPNAWPPHKGPIPAQLKSYLAMVLAHELLPGHGEHLRRAANSPLSDLFGFTRSPLGLEGWGVYAEAAILHVETLHPLAARTVEVHRLRRLTAAAQFLCKTSSHARYSRDLAGALTALPQKERDLITVPHTSPVQMLCYAIGLIETEQSLAEVAKQLNTTSSTQATLEHYLSWGPLAPKSIVDLPNAMLTHLRHHRNLV
jgi:hypothetical protein